MMEKWNVIQFPGMKAGKGGTEAREELSVRLKQWLGSRKAVQMVASLQMGTAANVYGIPARKGDDPE
ncbi:hypothetical protein Q0F98_16935 [Paenibacillus amylolyticus]|nr:hypothetical protein Q0F98_16935 [Paenibacillus amylolyticus]